MESRFGGGGANGDMVHYGYKINEKIIFLQSYKLGFQENDFKT